MPGRNQSRRQPVGRPHCGDTQMTDDKKRKSLVIPTVEEDESPFESGLRPQSLDEYVGQEHLKANLRVFIEAARTRKEALDHVLFHGHPGLGKTTLAYIIAKELAVDIRATSGPVIEKTGDLAAILTNLKEHDVLFIDEIHRMNRSVEEMLYPAMEDYQLDIIIGQGPSARSIKLELPRFTLVGATTRAGLLTPPLRDRFGVALRVDFYTPKELQIIITRSAGILGIPIDGNGSHEIARRSRGTPRIANRLLRRVRDFAQVRADGKITQNVAAEALQMLEVDEHGFDRMDRQILVTIVEKFDGGPIGVDTLATALCEERGTIEDVYEPYLIQCGYIHRTPRGRVATRLAYEYLNKRKKGNGQESLFGKPSH